MGRGVSILLLVVLSVLHRVYTQPQVELSLEGGPDSNSGRVVVVWYGSTRGTICSDGFDNNAAVVICRILGKSPNGAVYTSTFGPGTGVVILSRLECQGHERGLLECEIGRWGQQTGCQHSQDVGVICGGSSPAAAPCDNNPCRNGATCINLDQNRYRCDCLSGFGGRDCENTIRSLCDNNPCRNGAACINLDENTYRCDCRSGFAGRDCESTIRSACDNRPCQNGATCENNGNTYICRCTVGYEGNDCERRTATGICGTIPCKNGGTCNPWQFSPGYYCFCTNGYSGNNCTAGQRQPCDNQPCLNGGACRNDGSNYICNCPAGYSGPTCSVQTIAPAPPIPTPSPGAACRDAFLARPNTVGFNAGRYPALTTTTCSDACLTSFPTCFGYDWRGACYLSLKSFNPNNLQRGTGTNYERIFSCRTSAPPENAPGSCRDGFITYQNQYVVDGAFVQTSSTQDCANKCLQSALRCYGYGIWDRVWCFLLFYTHSASDVRADTRWTRYQRLFTCLGPGTQPIPGQPPPPPPPPPNLTPAPGPVSLRAFLVNGPDDRHGRVVLQYNGENGTVCDDEFDYNDARVICRMLGYFGSDVSTAGYAFGPGPDSVRVWLDNVQCTGSERDISACAHRGWGVSDCGHSEDISILCGPRVTRDALSVTLEGGPDRLHGRVTVTYNNERGTVCDDDFDTNDARVICRMLGYRGSMVTLNRGYGEGSGRILLDNVFCHGNETSLRACFYPPIGTHDCGHAEDIGIDCGPTSASVRVFLVDGPDRRHGRVVIEYNGVNGTVCDDGFGYNEARVICGMLGYSGSDVSTGLYSFGVGADSVRIWLDDVECSGSERQISSCPHEGWGVHDCAHLEDASVLCGPRVNRDRVSVSLEGGPDRLHGRIIVTYNNERGTVCQDDFDTNDARVICRMLGYRGSSVAVASNYGPGVGRIWLDNVFCHGNETSISECFYPPLGAHDCDHSKDVGINCGPAFV